MNENTLVKRTQSLLVRFGGLTSVKTIYAKPDGNKDAYFPEEPLCCSTSLKVISTQTDVPAAVTMINKTIITVSEAKKTAGLFRPIPGMQDNNTNVN